MNKPAAVTMFVLLSIAGGFPFFQQSERSDTKTNRTAQRANVQLSTLCSCRVLVFDDASIRILSPDGENKLLFGIPPADDVAPSEYILSISADGQRALLVNNKTLSLKSTLNEETTMTKNIRDQWHPSVAGWSSDGSAVAWVESEPYSYSDENTSNPAQNVFLYTLTGKKIIPILDNSQLTNIQKVIPLNDGLGVLTEISQPNGRGYWLWTETTGWNELTLPASFLAESVNPLTPFQLTASTIAVNSGRQLAILHLGTREFDVQTFTPWSPYFITRSLNGKIYGLIDDPNVAYGRLVELNGDLTEKRTIIKKFTLGDGFASVAWIPETERVIIRDQSVDRTYTADLSLATTELQPLTIKGYEQSMGRIVGLLK